jgi:hypothetical protein
LFNDYTLDTFLGGGGGGGIGAAPYFSVKFLSLPFYSYHIFQLCHLLFMVMTFPCLDIPETVGFSYRNHLPFSFDSY